MDIEDVTLGKEWVFLSLSYLPSFFFLFIILFPGSKWNSCEINNRRIKAKSVHTTGSDQATAGLATMLAPTDNSAISNVLQYTATATISRSQRTAKTVDHRSTQPKSVVAHVQRLGKRFGSLHGLADPYLRSSYGLTIFLFWRTIASSTATEMKLTDQEEEKTCRHSKMATYAVRHPNKRGAFFLHQFHICRKSEICNFVGNSFWLVCSKTMWLGHLSKQTTEDDLSRILDDCGKVLDIHVCCMHSMCHHLMSTEIETIIFVLFW